MEKKNDRNFDAEDEKVREENYSGNKGTRMPKEETEPEVIRNPESDASTEKSNEKNPQRPTPGTL